jgi:hypothetical protein
LIDARILSIHALALKFHGLKVFSPCVEYKDLWSLRAVLQPPPLKAKSAVA